MSSKSGDDKINW